MRTTLSIVILSGMVWLLSGCTGQQYRQVLDRADRQNAAFDSITNMDSLQLAATYFDRHGTANEQVRAHYLLGCAYRDAAEAPKALEAYHDAADRADTTRADCDYHLLMRLHAQMAELFYQQLLPYEMIGELNAQYRCARRAGDEKAAMNALERRANAYYLLEMPDSIISIRMKASEAYSRLGCTEEAAQALGPLIELLTDRGDTAGARKCIDRYESSSSFFDAGEPIPRKAVHYYYKGKYYLAVGQPDSAQILFRRLLQPGRTPSQQEAGFRGLYLLYKQTSQKDSMAKYADMSYQQTLSQLAATNTDNLRHMQSLYNYSRSQQLAQQMTDKAHRQQLTLYVVVAIAVILLLAVTALWQYYRRKRRALQVQYHQEQANLQKALNELNKLKEAVEVKDSRIGDLVEEKEADVRIHQEQIRQLEEKLKIRRSKDVNEQLMRTQIYRHFKDAASNPKARISNKDWQNLQDMIDEMIPGFYARMNSQRQSLSLGDYQICILVRLFFTPKEISNLTGNSPSSVSMKRFRLLQKVFNINGSAETFDRLVQQIA
jgi:tetratricopeptide (TPR) repeat protein